MDEPLNLVLFSGTDDKLQAAAVLTAGAAALGKPVNVFGMQAAHDDVVHADYHGAVVVPAETVRKLPHAVDLIARREKVILDICRSPDFSVTKLKDAVKRAGEIH